MEEWARKLVGEHILGCARMVGSSPCRFSLSPHQYIGTVESGLLLYMSGSPSSAYMMTPVSFDCHLECSGTGIIEQWDLARGMIQQKELR